MADMKKYYSRKAKYIQLLGGVCVSCGTTENLEFHKEKVEKNMAELLLAEKYCTTTEDVDANYARLLTLSMAENKN